jgi:PAS domain S-box-containing protein
VTASREARALERRLSAAVEQTAESVVITDVEGRIVYVNPAFERVSGYGRDEVMGLTPRVLQSGFQDERFYAQMWALLAAGKPWTGELVNRAKDGRTYVEEASITPIRDGSGVTTNYVAVKRDATREREVDAILAASREERLQVARILAEFEPADTPEGTGAAIVSAVQALPDIAAAWIVIFDPDGAASIVAATPAPFPADYVGRLVPPERAAGLLRMLPRETAACWRARRAGSSSAREAAANSRRAGRCRSRRSAPFGPVVPTRSTAIGVPFPIGAAAVAVMPAATEAS